MGSCLCCGECCKWLPFTYKGLANNRLFIHYYKTHGCKIEGDTVMVPMRCPQLTEDNKCKVHGTNKQPLFCSAWKGQRRGTQQRYVMPKDCGYRD